MSLPKLRFRESDQTWFNHSDDILVACPKCGSAATVRRRAKSVVRVTCSNCAFTASLDTWDTTRRQPATATLHGQCPACGEQTRGTRRLLESATGTRAALQCTACGTTIPKARVFWQYKAIGMGRDPHFGLPLYLQTRSCGQRLWAQNAAHLAFIRNYVAADLRERVPNINRSIASRLPTWMKLAANRPKVLRAIASLEARLLGRKSRPRRTAAV